jgi:SAM-dependent methyltransferase
MTGAARRWEVSPQELRRIAEARQRPLGARGALVVLLRNPGLLPELARIVGSSVRASIFANNSLTSLLDASRARVVAPDVASGVGWYDQAPFLEALTPQLRPDRRALELGCGAGRISRHVAPLVSELVCTDRSRAMIGEARENLSACANVQVATTDGFALTEFRDATFDVVFGQGVVGYLGPNELLALLDEVRRVLVIGGVCVFNFLTIDDPDEARAHLRIVRGMARRRRFSGAVDCAYTRGHLEALYRAAGLDVVGTSTGSGGEDTRGRLVLTASRPPAESGVHGGAAASGTEGG